MEPNFGLRRRLGSAKVFAIRGRLITVFIRGLALATAMLAVASSAAAAPLEAYGRLPAFEAAAMAPDGKHFALVTTEGDERRILIKDVESGQSEVMATGRTATPDIRWAGPRYLLVTYSRDAEIIGAVGPDADYTTIRVFDVETRKGFPLLVEATTGLNVTVGRPQIRKVGGETQVFVKGVRFDNSGEGRLALYRIDPAKRRSVVLHTGFPNSSDWLVGGDGEPLAESGYDPANGQWSLKLKSQTGWRYANSIVTFADTPRLIGLGRDGTSVLVEDDEDGRSTLRELAPDAAGWPEPFADGQEVILDPLGAHMVGASRLAGDERRYDFQSPQDQQLWSAVQAAYPGQLVELVSWSEDRQRLIVSVDSSIEGRALAYVDWSKKKADWIGPYYPQLTRADIAAVQPVRFKAADGLELSSYLTLPNNRAAKDLPLVVLAHGGPAARDEPGFDWWAQALASRGYAVLQVNFRGSAGLGRAFLEAGYGQLGGKMQTDLSDGVRHLAAQGLIDARRVCIVGADYGGYAALAGATLDRGVYRCAASVGGVSDLRSLLAAPDGQDGRRYWMRFLGADGPNDRKLIKLSPLYNAEGLRTPILLVHQRDDKLVPAEQSYAMAEALKAAGAPAEMVVMSGEEHWLSRGETRLRMLNAVTMFLEKNNPPS